MIYTLTLNPALDYDIYLNNLEKGNLNLSKNINYRAGGKGINVSIMLKNLGYKSSALGFIAGFTGDFIIKDLESKNINSSFISTEGITRINVKINENIGETEIAGISNNIKENDLNKLYDQISNLNNNDILVLSGSIPSNLSNKIYYEISKKTKAKTILDTRGNLLLENINNNILIKPNIHELEEVFNQKIEDFDTIHSLCQTFLNKGVETVIVSMGSKGAILIKKDRYLIGNIPKGKYINSIGAGDSMVAGFAYGYVNNLNIEETFKLAIACGSSTAYSYGIGNKELIDELINKIEIQEVIKCN